MKRRQVVGFISTLSLASLIPSFLFAKAKKATKEAAQPKNLLKLDDPIGKAMQYKHIASKAPVRTDKKAFCYNCAKYNVCAPGDKCKPVADVNKAAYAPCSVFAKKVVAKEGWCLSWQKKA